MHTHTNARTHIHTYARTHIHTLAQVCAHTHAHTQTGEEIGNTSISAFLTFFILLFIFVCRHTILTYFTNQLFRVRCQFIG